MRSVPLQAALTAYVEAVGEHLAAEVAGGAEIPFELEQHPRSRGSAGPSLYCYRPLTVDFIAARRAALEALPEFDDVSRLLAGYDGLERYLVAVGEDPRRLSGAARVRVAIGLLLGEVFAEQSDFELHAERVAAAVARIQSTAFGVSIDVTILATLHGMTITSPELPLTGGLTIAHLDALDGLPGGALESDEQGEHLVVVLNCQQDEPGRALARGRAVLEELLRALRLFGDGRVTLGAMAWSRVGATQWVPVALGCGGRPHGMLVVTAEQEDELRAFCNLVSRRSPEGNELAWALRRFEMACEREDPHEALSDTLLGLRALLEPEGPGGGLLEHRLAALCATREHRHRLVERASRAQALERAVIAGSAPRQHGAAALVADMSDHLRALLRDVICGHLDADLIGLADELLLADATPPADAGPAQPEQQSRQVQGPAPPPGALEPQADASRGVAGGTQPSASADQLSGDPREAEEILDLFV